jgi:hypothetical protein
MNREGPLDDKKARRVPRPLPHPSWRHGDPAARSKSGKRIEPEEFWARLGL